MICKQWKAYQAEARPSKTQIIIECSSREGLTGLQGVHVAAQIVGTSAAISANKRNGRYS